MDSKAVAHPYADRMVILLLCGFLLALAVEKWGLHRRLALMVLVRAGSSPSGLVGAVMAITAVLSMWISNTATTLMMLPIVLALVASARGENEDSGANRRFSHALLLGLAYSASIGGIATPVGTPPNLIFASVFAKHFPQAPEIDFLSWMQVGVPASLTLLLITWVLLTQILLKVPANYQLGDSHVLRERLADLGPWTSPERRVAVGFGLVCFFWIFRTKLGLPATIHDSTIAALGVIGFCLFPSGSRNSCLTPGPPDSVGRDSSTGNLCFESASVVLRPRNEGASERLLSWSDAVNVPWGLLLLFGGGIALSAGFEETHLTEWLGGMLGGLTVLPTLVLISGICLGVTFLTEVTSNTATTSLIQPVLAATAKSTGVAPLLLMVPATLAASCAFMLPVATAPNAIVVGSRAVDQATMIRVGLILNLIGVIPLTLVVWWTYG
ncbi:MAG: hypothetical protein HN348_09135 [Proteobacteria bacterium]|nr:hypothetical protein [Pseudomonadota bacterium]